MTDTIALVALIEDGRLLLGHRAHAFLATSWTGRPTNAAPDEHDALRWFTSAELARLRLAHPSYLPWLTGLLAQEAPLHPGGQRRSAPAASERAGTT